MKQNTASRVVEIERLERQTWHHWLGLNLIAGVAILFLGVSGLILGDTDILEPLNLILPVGLFSLVTISCFYFSYRNRRMSRERVNLAKKQYKHLVKVQKDYNRLMELNVSSRTLASKKTWTKLYNRIIQITYDTFPSDRVSLMVLISNELEVKAAIGRGDMDLVLGAKQAVGEGVAGWVAQNRRPLILGPEIDTSKFWRFKAKLEPILASLAVPVMLRDELLAVISISREAEDPFSQQDLQAMQVLAYNAAVSMQDLQTKENSGTKDHKQKAA